MMKKTILRYLCFASVIFVFACSSNNDFDGISIDPNNITTETLNGTWETTFLLEEDGEKTKIGTGWDIYRSRCPEKPYERRALLEYSFGIDGGEKFTKTNTKDYVYDYDNESGCNTSGKTLRFVEEETRFDTEEIIKVFVDGNKIYFEVRESDGYQGYYYYQYRIIFEKDKILYGYIDHLGKQNNPESLAEMNFRNYQLLKKVSNSVDLSRYNDGIEFVIYKQ